MKFSLAGNIVSAGWVHCAVLPARLGTARAGVGSSTGLETGASKLGWQRLWLWTQTETQSCPLPHFGTTQGGRLQTPALLPTILDSLDACNCDNTKWFLPFSPGTWRESCDFSECYKAMWKCQRLKMAKILNKEPSVYKSEQENFLTGVRKFHDSKGWVFKFCPISWILAGAGSQSEQWICRESQARPRQLVLRAEDNSSNNTMLLFYTWYFSVFSFDQKWNSIAYFSRQLSRSLLPGKVSDTPICKEI